MDFANYQLENFFDELFEAPGRPRIGSKLLVEKIESLSSENLLTKQRAAETMLLQMGITFNVYGNDEGTEKIFPFDIIPRIVDGNDWGKIESGLKQRIRCLNLFIDDIYHERKILKDKVVPEGIVYSSKTYRKACEGLNPPKGIWCHVTGTDLRIELITSSEALNR